jgi:hypothetical protein
MSSNLILVFTARLLCFGHWLVGFPRATSSLEKAGASRLLRDGSALAAYTTACELLGSET